mgnify:FL=1
MKTPTTLFISLFICTVLFGQAEDKKTSFSLKEAKTYAAEHSYFSRSAIMDVKKAEQRIKEVTGMGLPQINASAGYNYFLEIPVQLAPASSFNPMAPADEFIEFQLGVASNMKAGISVSQLLFDGSYIVGLKASKTYRELVYAQKAKTDAEIARDVTKSYGMVLASDENLKLIIENEKQLQKMVDEADAMYEAGFMEEKDVDQLRLLLLNTQNLKIQTENQQKVATDMLKFTMGMPIKNEIDLTEKLDDIKNPFSNKDQNLNSKLVVENHVEYQAATVSLRAQELTLSNEKMGNYPKLYGSFAYEGNSFGNDFNHFSSGGSWFPTSVIGVQLNVPIFAGGMRHNKIQQAKVSVEQANLRLDQTEQGLFLDMASKKSAYETAINKLDNSSKNIELAGKIKKQTQIKYSEGMSSSVELTQTENQYLQSQMNYIMAVIEVIQAKADLDYAIGTK